MEMMDILYFNGGGIHPLGIIILTRAGIGLAPVMIWEIVGIPYGSELIQFIKTE